MAGIHEQCTESGYLRTRHTFVQSDVFAIDATNMQLYRRQGSTSLIQPLLEYIQMPSPVRRVFTACACDGRCRRGFGSRSESAEPALICGL
jgi:hypothetical protein